MTSIKQQIDKILERGHIVISERVYGDSSKIGPPYVERLETLLKAVVPLVEALESARHKIICINAGWHKGKCDYCDSINNGAIAIKQFQEALKAAGEKK